MSVHGTKLPIRDVSLFVRVMGEGDPLLLMHGGPGLDHTTLLSLEPLADEFTLVFYDHRGNGRSTGAVESMTWDNLVADAEALREHLGFETWSVLGHSFGGQVALEYILRCPERVSRLLLCDSCGEMRWYQESAAEIVRKRGYGADAVDAVHRFFNGEMRPDEVSHLVRKFLRAYFHDLGVFGLPRAALHARHMKMRPEATVFGFGTLMRQWSVMEHLWSVNVPTLVLAGRSDFLFPSEHQAILADRIPDAQLEIIECAGHNPHDERTADVVGIIRRFMAAHPVVERYEMLVR